MLYSGINATVSSSGNFCYNFLTLQACVAKAVQEERETNECLLQEAVSKAKVDMQECIQHQKQVNNAYQLMAQGITCSLV